MAAVTLKKKIAAGIVLVIAGLGAVSFAQGRCLSVWVQHGVKLRQCPAGKMLPAATFSANGLRRGSEGHVSIGAEALFTWGDAGQVQRTSVDTDAVELLLVVDDQQTPLSPKEPWKKIGNSFVGQVALPADLPDGDHTLRVKVTSSLGSAEAEGPLSLYAPARIHVLTDRPLYEPGNTVSFRALALRARDLSPLSQRPGQWRVRDPSGVVVLEEKVKTDAWGIAAGALPLDDQAPTGTWVVEWQSAGASSSQSITVEPFTLPRFTVEASAVRPWYEPGQSPRLLGEVRYASGAPVKADVAIRWSSSGAWPPPRSWFKDDLPKQVSTDENGRFEIAFPKVPMDLKGQVTIRAVLDAVDGAGDRISGVGSVLLSEDGIQVQAVTELDGRLLDGFNNRLYLRAMTAAGRPLSGVDLDLRRAWDPSAKGELATTDVDGVALFQLDPGPPVTVVIPPMPVRPPPPVKEVQRTSVYDVVRESSPSLKDTVALDKVNDSLKVCNRFVTRQASVDVYASVAPSGRFETVNAVGPLGECVAQQISKTRLTAGDRRLLRISYQLQSELPTLNSLSDDLLSSAPTEVSAAIDRALLDARRCLPKTVGNLGFKQMLLWETKDGRFRSNFERDPTQARSTLRPADEACARATIAAALRGIKLERKPPDGLGLIRFSSVAGPRSSTFRQPQPTTMLGYELKVWATAGKETIGKTTLRLEPGTVPPVRLRATPVLAKAGEKVSVKLLRGPSFRGELPEKLSLVHEQKTIDADVDKEKRTAVFELPKDLDGWFSVSFQGAQTRIYVQPDADLAVDLQPEQPVYRPGDTARLMLTTTAGGKPVQASSTLVGVDETLGQLAPLPGPDALSGLTPAVSMVSPAFGVLEGTALAQGRILGDHAAAATVMRVSSVPTKPELDVVVSSGGATAFDAVGPLTDRFYAVLERLHDRVRAWELKAPEGEVMRPDQMVKLWNEALAAHEAGGGDVRDAFGTKLTLRALPDDLLQLVDPRQVVVDGKRLPEDVENWTEWVRRRAS